MRMCVCIHLIVASTVFLLRGLLAKLDPVGSYHPFPYLTLSGFYFPHILKLLPCYEEMQEWKMQFYKKIYQKILSQNNTVFLFLLLSSGSESF